MESELKRKPHEAVSFIIRELFDAPGLLIDEAVLAIRLGVDKARSNGWKRVKEHFRTAQYAGVAANGFRRWWIDLFLVRWLELNPQPPFRLSAEQRIAALSTAGFHDLTAIAPVKESQVIGLGFYPTRRIQPYGSRSIDSRFCLEHGCVSLDGRTSLVPRTGKAQSSFPTIISRCP